MDEDFTIPSDIMPITRMESVGTGAGVPLKGASTGNHSMNVIVESLLDLLLSFYEQDESRRSELLDLIWESLNKVIPISNSFKSPALCQLRGQYQMVFKKLIKVSQKKLGYSSSPLQIRSGLSSDFSQSSRYHSEFEEIQYIAKGGFGSVFRVRNKLDHFEYAVKKILLKCDKDWQKFAEVTKEVIVLAKLRHPNIVNYKTAWIEPTSIIDVQGDAPGSTSSSSESSFSVSEWSGTSQSIQFLESSSANSPPQSKSVSGAEKSLLLPSSCLRMGAVLYLQMELCETTLREWMDNRASDGLLVDSKVNTYIFTQILEGVAYIHSQGIIHRDLKPRNIFIKGKDNTVQIGDFGLAKEEIQSNVVPPESPLQSAMFKYKKSNGCVGTHAYASPEQSSYGWVDYKSDIYSLGIILYELFSKFDTGMERSIAINNLKDKCTLDPTFEKKFPQIAQYILWLTDSSPYSRPTAQELLDSEFSKVGQLRLSLLTENIILKETIETRNKELENCRNILANREKEIESLKKQLLEK